MKRFLVLLSVALVFALFLCSKKDQPSVVGERTAALEDKAWESSEWISAVDAPVVDYVTVNHDDPLSRSADFSSWFVTKVKNPSKVVSARWMTTGLGVYQLYLNGVPVGEEFLKPGFTHYQKTKYSFTYDITEAFEKSRGAENVLSAQLTPGWWADKILTPGGHKGMHGDKCAFRAVLELVYSDGTREYRGTNTSEWKAGVAGPVMHASIFDGEEYDARRPMGYDCWEDLKEPEINTEFAGEILPSDGAEVYLRKDLTLSPVRAYVWDGVSGAVESEDKAVREYGKVNIVREYAPGTKITIKPGETLVVDFGQNAAAVPSFLFKAAEGTVLTCLPAELLNDGNGAARRNMDGPEGSVHRDNLRIAKNGVRNVYTFGAADGFVPYHATCTFFGYRFISVTATAEVVIRKVESIPVTSITKEMETGSITTGDDLINKLISNTVWGQRSNYLSVPTDCPQRNERLGWTADTQVFSGTGAYFANTNRFFHKWMRDMRDTQGEFGGFPGVAPLAQYGAEPNSMMRLGWADAGIIVPWTIWKQFGDVSLIDENWEAMDRFICHINDTKYDHRALIPENGNYQWADWLSCEPLESCVNRAFGKDHKPLPEAIEYWCYLGASYWAIDASMMRDMAAASGRDASKYQAMVDAAKDYLRTTFLNSDGTFKTEILNTMQTPAVFALKNKLLEGEAKAAMIERLRANFAEHDGCLQTGFLGTSILLSTLTDNGMADIAWDLLFQHKNPSWLYSIDNGATTIWERWNSYTRENGLGPQGMNSFNHYAYGSVCQWIWETVAGIASDPSAPGFKHIIMKPVPDKRLGSVKAEYRSAAGLIKSSWHYDGDSWIWEFTVPEGSTATVTLPGDTESEEYAAGSYRIERSL